MQMTSVSYLRSLFAAAALFCAFHKHNELRQFHLTFLISLR